MCKTVVIVDNHPSVRRGFTQVIEREPDLSVVGEAGDAATAKAIIRSENPDMALVDLALRNPGGLQLIRDLKQRNPDFPVLAVSLYDGSIYAETVIRAGANGFIMKAESIDRVLDAIRQVLLGNIYLSDANRRKILEEAS